MRFGKSTNPALSSRRFENLGRANGLQNANVGLGVTQAEGEVMTLKGVINKTLLLFGILLLTGTIAWKITLAGSFNPRILMFVGAIGSLILAFVIIAKPQKSATLAPIYAALEGLFVGSISAFYNAAVEGIVTDAILLTLCVFAVMMILYRSGVIRATPKFRKGLSIAMGGILLFYLLNFVFSLFGSGVSLFRLGVIGIGIQLFIVGIAAMSLVSDFDMIERNLEQRFPKYMEWYSGFGLMVTLIWLYLEILRLLALFAGRD